MEKLALRSRDKRSGIGCDEVGRGLDVAVYNEQYNIDE